MSATVHGIHHVTAIAGDAQQNLDFYVTVLGLRLVKKSVNQDDPGTYHLFFADGVGTPGTDLTFFPWPRMARAQPGTGMVGEVSFAVPPGSLPYWQERLARHGVAHRPVEPRFGEAVLPLSDVHGLRLALVETSGNAEWVPWEESPVPVAHQLRGIHSVRLWERRLASTETVLTDYLGFRLLGTDDGWHRYGVEEGGSGQLVDVKEMPTERIGQMGSGGVHHVAWRVRDDEEELAVRRRLQGAGLAPTPQIDRFWFKSVYFREPGRVLFELATDGPGFDLDEEMAHLGEHLILPPWLEPDRAAIEAALPPLEPPQKSA